MIAVQAIDIYSNVCYMNNMKTTRKLDHRGVYKKNDKYWFGNLQVVEPDPISRIFMKTTVTDTCWLWNGSKYKSGYGFIKHEGKITAVHRFLYQTFFGPIDKNLVCCHKCDIRNCINPAHIFIGTRDDNQKDMRDKGRSAKGSRNGTAKLKDEDILNIRKMYSEGMLQREIANIYKMSQPVIGKITRRVTWRHI